MIISSQPEAMASSTPYWMIGLSTTGNISLGMTLVAGRNRVPIPAAGNTALRTFMLIVVSGVINVADRSLYALLSSAAQSLNGRPGSRLDS
jgi:hypothetical protein